MTSPLVGWVSIEFMYAREQAPAGALGLSTRTNRAPTFEPARRSKGLGTRYLATWVTFHGVVSSPLRAAPVYSWAGVQQVSGVPPCGNRFSLRGMALGLHLMLCFFW